MSSSRDSVSAHQPSLVASSRVAPPAEMRPAGRNPEQCGPSGEDLVGVDAHVAAEVGRAAADVARGPPRTGEHGVGDAQRAHHHILHRPRSLPPRPPDPSRVR